jgi:hypothetical protein
MACTIFLLLKCVFITFESSITCSLHVLCMLAYSNIRKLSQSMKAWWWHYAYVPVIYLHIPCHTVIWRYITVYVGISGCQDSRWTRPATQQSAIWNLHKCYNVGIWQVYTWHMTTCDVYLIYTRYIPDIYRSYDIECHMTGICLVYVWYISLPPKWYIPGIYQTYDRPWSWTYTWYMTDIWHCFLNSAARCPRQKCAWIAAAHRFWIARVFIVQHTTRRCHRASGTLSPSDRARPWHG